MGDSGGGAGAPVNPLFAAIEARRAATERRNQQIANGELNVVDPRAAREAEMEAQKRARMLGRKMSSNI